MRRLSLIVVQPARSQRAWASPTAARTSRCRRSTASRWRSRRRRRHGLVGDSSATRRSTRWSTEALANNEDLRIAAARVDQFQGAKVTTRAPLFPAIGYAGSTGEESRSELVYGPGADDARSFSSAGFTAGWEIDVWGRVRNLTAAADADWRASEADRRATVLAAGQRRRVRATSRCCRSTTSSRPRSARSRAAGRRSTCSRSATRAA